LLKQRPWEARLGLARNASSYGQKKYVRLGWKSWLGGLYLPLSKALTQIISANLFFFLSFFFLAGGTLNGGKHRKWKTVKHQLAKLLLVTGHHWAGYW
jgi:hypothetical protein